MYIKNQTLKICLTAVQQNSSVLEYVKIQTPEICMIAVKQNWKILQYIIYQTPEICAAAIKQNSDAYMYIRLPEDEDKRDKFLRELGLLLLAI